jgi:hypothetical protein
MAALDRVIQSSDVKVVVNVFPSMILKNVNVNVSGTPQYLCFLYTHNDRRFLRLCSILPALELYWVGIREALPQRWQNVRT